VAVVTNVEADHLEVYGDLAGVESGFGRFVDQVRDGGWLVACADDPGASRLLHGRGARPYSYGTSAGSMLRAVDVAVDPDGVRGTVVEEGTEVGELRLRMGGLHNLRNALGAAAAARRIGAGWDAICTAAASFAGVGRRFERLGEAGGVVVLDDYAHHPTEIEAALAAARDAYPGRRLVAAFQPHLYSRTRDFADEFGAAVAAADVAWITDVFPAREAPVAGVTGRLVADAAVEAGGADVRYHPELQGLAEAISTELDAGDVVVTLGAGSVEALGPELLRRMEAQHA
jgi:UDP-N-acetylmuramate--alanine ligase